MLYSIIDHKVVIFGKQMPSALKLQTYYSYNNGLVVITVIHNSV